MRGYHKIHSLYKREPAGQRKLIVGEYSRPEFEYLRDCRWEGTEKIDGTNIRIGWFDGQVMFNGRTENAQVPTRLVQWILATFTPEKMAQVFGPQGGLILFGEGYGAGIQKGGGGYATDGEQRVALFDVMAVDALAPDVCEEIWFERAKVQDAADALGVAYAPVVARGTLAELERQVKEGFQSRLGTCRAEGLVVRPTVELKNRLGGRVITKLKYRDFN